MKWRMWVVAALLLTAATVVGLAVQHHEVSAQTYTTNCPDRTSYGRKFCEGYFTGIRNTTQPNPYNAVFYNGLRKMGTRSWVNKTDDYIALMKAYLYDNDGSADVDYGSNDPIVLLVQKTDKRRNNIGAAHHIDIMLGKNGPDFGGSVDNGIKYARDNFATWEALVRSYDAAGRLHFRVASVTMGPDDDMIQHSTGQPPFNGDNEFFTSPYYITQSVRFDDENGNPVFQIEMDCGNIFGIESSLTTTTPPTPPPPPPSTPPAMACAGVTWDPITIDSDTPYTVTANIRYGSDAEAAAVMARPDTHFFVTIKGPGVNTNFNFDTGDITRAGPLLTVTTPQQPATGQTGKYIIGYGIRGSSGNISCGSANSSETNPPGFVVASKPYFSVVRGDISAGAGMSIGGSECASGGVAPNEKAGIVSWNRGASKGYAGAGTKYGALALGHIQDFATGQGSALAPAGAAFANTGGSGQQVDTNRGLFGGEYGSANCTGDYFQGVDPAKIEASQVFTGMAVPNCTGTNDAQCHKVKYINGDVYITGNVTFSGSYANTAAIPSFALVVKGNIYIAPGVTRLDGFYIAQPSNGTSTNGVIYTCATAMSIAAALDNTLSTICNSQLTVNGSFVARQVWLLRTAGSVSSTPAETFNYSPEAWLSTPFGNGLGQKSGDDYEAITGLPPVL